MTAGVSYPNRTVPRSGYTIQRQKSPSCIAFFRWKNRTPDPVLSPTNTSGPSPAIMSVRILSSAISRSLPEYGIESKTIFSGPPAIRKPLASSVSTREYRCHSVPVRSLPQGICAKCIWIRFLHRGLLRSAYRGFRRSCLRRKILPPAALRAAVPRSSPTVVRRNQSKSKLRAEKRIFSISLHNFSSF